MFADDGALLASTQESMVRAVKEYRDVGAKFGMSVSLEKTKHMVVRRAVDEEDQKPIGVEGGTINYVKVFPYLRVLAHFPRTSHTVN